MTLIGLTLLVALVGANPAEAEGNPPVLQPCETVASMGSIRLEQWARMVRELHLDRPAAETGGHLVARFITLPAWKTDPEKAVSVYLPTDGDATVESAHATSNIEAATAHWKRVGPKTFQSRLRRMPLHVNVEFHRRNLPRSLAEKIEQILLAGIDTTRMAHENDTWIVLDSPSHYFISWAEGDGNLCAQTEIDSPGTLGADLIAMGRALDRFTEQKADETEIRSSIDKAASNPLVVRARSLFPRPSVEDNSPRR